jgi:hypothetical protein
MLRMTLLFSLILSSTLSFAAPTPPPIPSGEDDKTTEEDNLEPQVTIIRRAESTVEEYRVNGQLYMVKITPDAGPAYYLVDTDGDGSLETTRHSLDANHNIPQWILFSW